MSSKRHFREGSLDIWGEKGRIEIIHEGLNYIETKIDDCRSLSGSFELASDNRIIHETGYGEALFNLYDNLFYSLSEMKELDCSGNSTLITERVVEALFNSFKKGGIPVKCK